MSEDQQGVLLGVVILSLWKSFIVFSLLVWSGFLTRWDSVIGLSGFLIVEMFQLKKIYPFFSCSALPNIPTRQLYYPCERKQSMSFLQVKWVYLLTFQGRGGSVAEWSRASILQNSRCQGSRDRFSSLTILFQFLYAESKNRSIQMNGANRSICERLSYKHHSSPSLYSCFMRRFCHKTTAEGI